MSRPQKQKQITYRSSSYQRLTATVLLGSFLQTTISTPAIAQQAKQFVVRYLPLINQAYLYIIQLCFNNQKI